MTDDLRDRVAEVLANLYWTNKATSWEGFADAVLPLLAEAEARGVERGRAEVRGIRFRVEVACDGYENLTDADIPVEFTDDYREGAAEAARQIRAALTEPELAPDVPNHERKKDD